MCKISSVCWSSITHKERHINKPAATAQSTYQSTAPDWELPRLFIPQILCGMPSHSRSQDCRKITFTCYTFLPDGNWWFLVRTSLNGNGWSHCCYILVHFQFSFFLPCVEILHSVIPLPQHTALANSNSNVILNVPHELATRHIDLKSYDSRVLGLCSHSNLVNWLLWFGCTVGSCGKCKW